LQSHPQKVSDESNKHSYNESIEPPESFDKVEEDEPVYATK